MALFYNTASPTPSTKNNITDIAVTYGIRDFLLNKNLLPVYPQISTSLNGSPRIGEPVLDTSINGNANVIPFGLPLETEGLFRYDVAILPNQFKNTDLAAPSLLNIDDIATTQNALFGNVDFPQGTQSYPTSSNQDVKTYGLVGKSEHAGFRKNSTIKNLYLDADKQVDMADFISLQPAGFSQQIKGYLDEYGALNLGDGNATQIADIIGSVLNGQGIGFTKSGVVNNFDIRSSLAGRVLGATGVINDTKLGMIGGQQLALALANNAAFNVEQKILGGLNITDNVLSIVKNGTTVGFRPNYQITVPSGGFAKAVDFTERVLGFTVPKSYLEPSGSIFVSENPSANIQRANSMLLNTGKGQLNALITNVNANIGGSGDYDKPEFTAFRSGYVPGYLNHKGEAAINPALYAFYDDKSKGTIYPFAAPANGPNGFIPEISYRRAEMVKEYGFLAPEDTFTGPRGNSGYNGRKVSDVGFTWTTSKGGLVNSNGESAELPLTEKKSILTKTQKLFNSKGMKTIVTAKGDMGHTSSQLETANANGISKGSAVLSAGNFDSSGRYVAISAGTPDQVYCRSWTTLDRYDQVNKLIRHSGLNEKVPYRFQYQNSTLGKYGFPKIAPYTSDKQYDSSKGTVADPKNYMFSIENLAWADTWENLPPVEVGMGDLMTGKKGRIMWFPPYNIQFSESSNVSWETNNFIGRGEPIYTYNNTERSGNLSFSIVVDHPSYINSFRNPGGPDDNYVASFFAGCIDPNSNFADKLTVSEKSAIQESQVTTQQKAVIPSEPEPPQFEVYYPNDEDDVTKVSSLGYENGYMNNSPTPSQEIDYSVNCDGFGHGINAYVGGVTSDTTWYDRTNFGFNGTANLIELEGSQPYSGWTDPGFLSGLDNYLQTKCPNCVINIKSYASAQGNAASNKKLADGRTQSLYNYLFSNLYNGKTDEYKKARIKADPNNGVATSDCNPAAGSETDNESCKKDRKSVVTFKFSDELAQKDLIQPAAIIKKTLTKVSTKITNRLYNESAYFEELTDIDSFVFDSFREKIKYFHPAFHSTTPEGLNSRLTFLQQCTRQGPTLESKGADNLAFGRPPICILRIGDFYNTKIVIDNITIDYEPLVWDLNPEGVGVQPMIANVTMSFKFIGGSTLMGPINKLQNALSFNYYANTHVYDPRADYISQIFVTPSGWGLVNGATSLTGYTNSSQTTTDVTPPEVNQVATANNATNGNKSPSVIPISSTTSGYTSVEIQRSLNITSITYEKDDVLGDYDIKLVLKFTPMVDVDNFILKESEYVRGKLYIRTDDKRQIVFGDLDMHQNSTDTVAINNNTIPTASSDEDQLVYSYGGNKYNNTTSRESIVLLYRVDSDDVIKFIDEALKTKGAQFTIKWGSGNGAEHNSCFPYISA